ncbi:DNA polymerase III subunit gamma/tau [Patescibacteria group bacterium]|nr:DNA polymerase III subunit gamma/tau [Patescibacteria group bacterium]MBU4057662.1 DNA polymerase III subunit gamma/tau [Patescibacteria group bacterium]
MKNMEIALYRKYRPEKFKDVLGQKHITDVIEGTIKNGSISHAYLFAGSRGIGKTSVARILAREIGCKGNDLYEIDAASNRGIDDIRELRESINTLPFESPYKVYIIDEVHMLTKEAFNALLKTLEEPPEYAIFVLATTEMHKLPDTVVSRCEVYQFKKPSQAVIKNMVEGVVKKEGFSLEQSSAELISLLGDGSFRDAMGILQKIIRSSKDKKMSVDEVERITGAPRGELINKFIKMINDGDLNKSLEIVNKATENNVDMKVFVKLILHKMRGILLLRFSKEMEKEIKEELGEEDFKFLKQIADAKETKINSSVLKEFIDAYNQVGKSALPQLPIELALVKVIQKE